MPAILIATDFSAVGDNAAYYGASLAQNWECELVLLHSYYVPVTFNDPGMPIIPIDELQEANIKRMAKSAAAVQQAFPGLKITTRIDYGDIEDTVAEVMEELKPLLVIIGSHLDEGNDFWTGNTAIELLRNSKTPILAVPADYTFRPVQKICIAVDTAGMAADGAFMSLQSFLKRTNASLHVLHVAKEVPLEQDTRIPVSMPDFEAGIDVRFHLTDAQGNIDDEIAGFTAANNIDWLVVIPHHYTFWESLFHKSHTKAMVHKSGIPLLALH